MLVQERHTQRARKLLAFDEYLLDTVKEHLRTGHEALSRLGSATAVLKRTREALEMTSNVSLSSLWIRAAAGEMADSPLLRETMLAIKKTASDKLMHVFGGLEALQSVYFPMDMEFYRQDLEQLVHTAEASGPLRSQDDVRKSSLRATVVAQKVELSKHKAAMSAQDKLYSGLVARFSEELGDYFATCFVDPRSRFAWELLLFDLKSPHTEVFAPKPRFAIERALASPHDYLGCECCENTTDADGEVGKWASREDQAC